MAKKKGGVSLKPITKAIDAARSGLKRARKRAEPAAKKKIDKTVARLRKMMKSVKDECGGGVLIVGLVAAKRARKRGRKRGTGR